MDFIICPWVHEDVPPASLYCHGMGGGGGGGDDGAGSGGGGGGTTPCIIPGIILGGKAGGMN